jgi:hypothetical protein
MPQIMPPHQLAVRRARVDDASGGERVDGTGRADLARAGVDPDLHELRAEGVGREVGPLRAPRD